MQIFLAFLHYMPIFFTILATFLWFSTIFCRFRALQLFFCNHKMGFDPVIIDEFHGTGR